MKGVIKMGFGILGIDIYNLNISSPDKDNGSIKDIKKGKLLIYI